MAARRVALITGGGRGIGRAIALAFAREGLAVAVAARTRRQVEGTADDARDLGATVLAVALDVTEPAAVGTAVREVARALGPVDVLVNNAGIAESAPDMVWRGARNTAAKTGRSFEEAVAVMARANPGGRLIEPGEVAAAAVTLVHDERTNGETVILDGSPRN